MNLNNDFEKSKKQLQVSESIKKVKNNYLVKNTIVELIRSIPVFGPLLDDSIDATLTEFQEAKREELLSIISKDIGNITTDMVNNVEFIMNFAKTEVVAIFSGISKTGFCAEVVGTYLGYTGGVFYITSSCEKFVKMITGGLYE